MNNPLWPSLEIATRVFDWANIALIISLVAGVASTALVVWMGSIKEDYLEQELATTNERAAIAEQRTAEAQLKLEELRKQVRPRHITQAQQQEIANKLSAYKGHLVSLGVKPSNNENEWLVRWLGAAFSMAGWNVEIHSEEARSNRFVPDGILVQSTQHPDSISVAARVAEALNIEGLYTTTLQSLRRDPNFSITLN
ncbi:MAG: hypothetical protein EPO06_09915 [Burkholderiaceae bacterium]|nr:MAG: hypothetical protein EPO06_09915 [Burkholderiaceae bacterium]